MSVRLITREEAHDRRRNRFAVLALDHKLFDAVKLHSLYMHEKDYFTLTPTELAEVKTYFMPLIIAIQTKRKLSEFQ